MQKIILSKLLKKVNKDLKQDFIVADVSNSKDMKRLFEHVVRKYKRIDIMVNNAGITHLPKPMEKVSEKEFDKVFKVNAKSLFFTSLLSVSLNLL